MSEINELETRVLPMIPLRGVVIFPGISMHFDIGREMSVKAVEEAVRENSLIFLSLQKDVTVLEPGADDIYEIGVVGLIKQVLKLPGEALRVMVQSLYRARVVEYKGFAPAIHAEVERVVPIRKSNDLTIEALSRKARELFEQLTSSGYKLNNEVKQNILNAAEPDAFIDLVSGAVLKNEFEKQTVLETTDTEQRFIKIIYFLTNELEIAKLDKKITNKVRQSIDRGQKEYYLREQIRVIQDELGEGEDDTKDLHARIVKLGLPKDSEEKVLKELGRMAKMPPSSPEANVIRTYAEWICDLPWKKNSKDNGDLKRAADILNEDHYGLEKVKDRILEYLAVHLLTDKPGASILCFVGPPGVGKTSIAKSIARALDRKFVRMSLGGVKDEAEIRGHRRTYIGAMPGRIIYHMRNAGTVNPVFLLDEIDKMSSDFRGDPASAMLEVLDPEQNHAFRDHFLEIPYDLSKVMFICTANSLDSIPDPLLDRMEVINLTGYTDEEKLEIAKRYLIPKRAETNGMAKGYADFVDSAVYRIIREYTKESGVRNLEREIDNIFRKIAKKLIEERGAAAVAEVKKKDAPMPAVTVTAEDVEKFLGVPRYTKDLYSEQNEVGTVTGLAWTAVGGTTLTIEVTLMRGKGEIVLTGQLGDVMKESARTALSYIRSHADEWDLDPKLFTDYDLHIHVPEGAVPKDGPSAGITMATAILSALTDKPVSSDVAMTGEITLRGKILPIGGLKEKTLAAYRAGIHNIIIPKRNEKDMSEIPESVRSDINFILTDDMGTVFKNAILGS